MKSPCPSYFPHLVDGLLKIPAGMFAFWWCQNCHKFGMARERKWKENYTGSNPFWVYVFSEEPTHS